MKEFILRAKTYHRLLYKYNKTIPSLTLLFPLELMLMTYNSNDGVLKYPFCFGYPQRLTDKRQACTVMERTGLIERCEVKYVRCQRHYKLTLKGENICRDFMKEFKDELLNYNISL